MNKQVEIIIVPTLAGSARAKVVYKAKVGDWVVSKMEGVIDSALTYVGEELYKKKKAYGYRFPVYRELYYKGVFAGRKLASQKELILVCKVFNKMGYTVQKLGKASKEVRQSISLGIEYPEL